MTLTLGNDLTGTVAREVGAASRTASGLGESLTTGDNKFVEVVDGFLGSSLRDSEIILGAIAKNTAYSINMLTITDEYLKTVASSLQEGLKTIGSAGPLSADKLAVLQKNLNDKRAQVDLLIRTADFDGKALLGGGAEDIDVQIGLSITDKLSLSVNDISAGKLFRSSVTVKLNEYLAADASRSNFYNGAANAQVFADAIEQNENLIYTGLTSPTNTMTDAQLATALKAVIDADPSSAVASFLQKALPTTAAALDAANADVTFSTASVANLTAAFAAETNVTADARTVLIGGAVADGVDADTTAQDVATLIGGEDVPQAVKDAAQAAADVGGFADHDAAREAVRLAAINADPAMAIMQAVAPRDLTVAGAIGAGVPVADAATAFTAIEGLANISQEAIDAAEAAAALPDATVVSVRDAALLAQSNATGNRGELLNLLKDDAATNISVAGNEANRVIAQDVFQTALDTTRAEQASVANQKRNVIAAADALRATTNVTQKAADSYLKTDYVMTAQQYSETIRTMVASITSLQAANKIPEAAQRLIDALAR